MKLRQRIDWAGGFRRWVRWSLWERMLARCPFCVNMDRTEWYGTCDCFLPLPPVDPEWEEG